MTIKVLATNAVWTTLATLLARGSLVVASIILARHLDAAGFAGYSYFQLTVSMLAAYSSMGLGVTASRFFAESSRVEVENMPPVGTLWVASLLLGLMISLIVLCFPQGWLGTELYVPQWLLAVGILSMSIDVVPSGAILGLELYKKATYITAMSAIVLILGASLASVAACPVCAMVVFVTATLLKAIGNAIVVLRNFGLKPLLRNSLFRKVDIKVIASLAGPMTGVTFLAASGSWLVGRMILNAPNGSDEFALYAIGLQWFSLALFLPNMVARVVLPSMVKALRVVSNQTNGDAKLLTRQGVLLAVCAAVIVSLVGSSVSAWVLPLYGETLQINQWFLAAFMLAAIPSAPVNILGNVIVASNQQREWLAISIGWFCCLLVIARSSLGYGAWAGVIANGLASIVLATMAFIWARKKGLV